MASRMKDDNHLLEALMDRVHLPESSSVLAILLAIIRDLSMIHYYQTSGREQMERTY